MKYYIKYINDCFMQQQNPRYIEWVGYSTESQRIDWGGESTISSRILFSLKTARYLIKSGMKQSEFYMSNVLHHIEILPEYDT